MNEGRLLLISTPLGNLQDITPRTIEAFRSCSLLLCEDTRHTGRLLQHLGITLRTESFHEHNEDGKTERIIERIKAGEVIGVASDAGMPILSDPGFPLVRAARRAGIRVEPIAGAFAGAMALIASGIAPVPFTFYGFTPHRTLERRDFYRGMTRGRTAIIYESPMRLLESLEDLRDAFGDCEISVAREMTKLHEEFINGSVGEVLERLGTYDQIRGEITIVIAVPKQTLETPSPEELRAEFNRLREEGLRRTDATRVLAERHGLKKGDLYKILLD